MQEIQTQAQFSQTEKSIPNRSVENILTQDERWLPLRATVTALPFPGPLQFVFSTECVSEERYVIAQRLQESAGQARQVVVAME
ncbi:hypothetical protein EYF80_008032 [Liparis tanakae]|uniref:Uncharacterized protein n=1 Tax=Liparis tanakae TaxID=230148 RepID=A0A4Z2IUR4_9TELE|nr:hypothetical protein EYF80_008032 [Liparis tanakae]